MKKENEIIYKLLEDSRKKIKDTEKAFELLKEKFKDNNNSSNKKSELDKLKELYNKTLNEIDKLRKEIEILKSENDFYKGMNSLNKPNIKDINNKLSIFTIKENIINIISNINPNDSNNKSFIKEIFKSQNELNYKKRIKI